MNLCRGNPCGALGGELGFFPEWILSLVRFWDRAAGLLACGDGSDTGVWEERQAGVVRGANGRLRGGAGWQGTACLGKGDIFPGI